MIMLIGMFNHLYLEGDYLSFSRDYSKEKGLCLHIGSPFRFRFLPCFSFASYIFLPPRGRLDGGKRRELSSLQIKGLWVWATVADLTQASQPDSGRGCAADGRVDEGYSQLGRRQ